MDPHKILTRSLKPEIPDREIIINPPIALKGRNKINSDRIIGILLWSSNHNLIRQNQRNEAISKKPGERIFSVGQRTKARATGFLSFVDNGNTKDPILALLKQSQFATSSPLAIVPVPLNPSIYIVRSQLKLSQQVTKSN